MRSYSVPFQNVSVSAVEDLVSIFCGASMAVELHGIVIGQTDATSVQELRISVNRFASGYSAGSGGSAPTPSKLSRGDAAATATAHANDTVQTAVGSGSKVVLHSDVFNLVNGYQFFWPTKDIPDAGLNEALVLSLDTAPTSAVHISGTLYFGERI